MTRIPKILTCVLPMLLTAFTLAPQAQAQEGEIENPDAVLYVEGMACSMCARSMTNQLEELDAVKDVEVLLEEEQRVLLTLNEGTAVTEEILRAAVTKAGFSTIKVEFEAGDDRSQSSTDDSDGAADATAAAVQMKDGVQVINITAGDRGYEPMRIRLQEGIPARLIFTRTAESHCMEQVQIPAFGIEKTNLPLNEPIAIEFTPEESGAFSFACGMDMTEGTILVSTAGQ